MPVRGGASRAASGWCVAFEVVLAGPVVEPRYPAFWASSPSLSFLASPAEMRVLLAETGLRERLWQDTTRRTIAYQLKRKQALAAGKLPVLGLGVIVLTDLEAKMANGLTNNEEGRTLTVEAVYAS